MSATSPLPDFLVERYHGWKARMHAGEKAEFRRLATEGQQPGAMVIACCDSRVEPGAILGAGPGALFVHRNIAALVPPFATADDADGTAAAVEFAVAVLGIAHLVVMGHSQCGGAAGCHDLCAGEAPALADSFLGRWLAPLRPGYDRIAGIAGREARLAAMEREGVRISLANLAGYPFVARAVEDGHLALHGLRMEIASGTLEARDPASGAFFPL